MLAAAFRSLRLGPVVGARTWGGTVSFGTVHRLLDGSRITVPTLALSFEEYGWAIENHGVEPDDEVIGSPEQWASGQDPQIERAVRIAMEAR
jgi:tricorn protease